jgi:ADP-L-glycero-D-manno-heptose 6-epimerase
MGACSTTTEHDFDYLLENNVRYSIALAEHCRDNNIRFIYASSAATYGDGSQGYSDHDETSEDLRPLNRYGYSKQLFDQWVTKNDYLKQVVGLKFFNVYGPNEYHKGGQRSMVPQAYDQIKNTGKVKLFKSYRPDYADGEQQRDFVYVKDCTDVMWWLIENEEVNGIFNIGTGKARSWKDLANATFAALDMEPSLEYIDMPDVLKGQYQYFTEARMEKLKAAGYTTPFRSLEEGIKDYVQEHLEKGISFL